MTNKPAPDGAMDDERALAILRNFVEYQGAGERTLAALKHIAARLAQTAGESNHYRSALEEIANPIAAMQKRLEPGCRLNGGMAVSLSESAEYLKGIAKRVLASAPTSEAT